MQLTPIDEIEDMADGVPVLAVEGTVEYAGDITRGTTKQGKDWTKQFFVLGLGTAKIACSMFDAEGSEMAKGETVHIENTQNKKGDWSGMKKGSYMKDGERKHTLEIRASQVKITQPNGKEPRGDEHGIVEIEESGGGSTFFCEVGNSNPKPKHSMLDERQRAIIRQHSQSMALEVLKLKIGINQLTLEDLAPSKLKTLADYFDNDVLEATTVS